MANVQFTQTTRAKLPTINKTEGMIYFCTDTCEIFVDTMLEGTLTRIQYAKLPTNLSELYNDVGYLDNNTGDARYVKKSGDTMTGALKTSSDGITATDLSGTVYPMIRQGDAGLWIGASNALSHQHVGTLQLSTGYNRSTQSAYPAPYAAIANSDNTVADIYPMYHKGFRPYRYGVCSTAAGTAAKVVTTSIGGPGYEAATGEIIFIKFTDTNTASASTLNVNGTGDKPIYRYGSTTPGTTEATSWAAGSVIGFIYDGSAYQMLNWLNTDTDTTYSEATTSQAGLMSAADKATSDVSIRTAASIYNPRPFDGSANSATIWSNATNNIGIGMTQISDTNNYRFYVRDDSISFACYSTSGPPNYTPSTVTKSWTIYPTSGTAPIAVSNGVVSHNTSGVTAATYGTNSTTALTPAFGATFSVPGFAVNATGHVTSASSHTVKMPNSVATTSAAGLMSAIDKVKVSQAQIVSSKTDSLEFSLAGTFTGFVTNSAKDIRFFVPTVQSANNINFYIPTEAMIEMLSYYSLTASVRGPSGYVSGQQYVADNTYINIHTTSDRGVTFNMRPHSGEAWSNVTNNQPCSVSMVGTITVKLK